MNKKSTIIFVVTGIVVLVAGLFWLSRDQDIIFARRVFSGLINGDQAVKEMIDWASFKVVGIDAGKAYSGISQARTKEVYCKSFIANFSISFKSFGIKFGSFTNWRVYQKTRMSATVAVDHPSKKVLLFTISNKYGKRKLISLQWKPEP